MQHKPGGRAAAVEERVARVGGRVVRFRVAGRGSAVVLVHGLAGSWRWWQPVLPALAERYAVHYSAAGRVAALVRSFLEEGEEGAGGSVGDVEHRHVPGAGEDDEADVG